jgi:hypothetical protein
VPFSNSPARVCRRRRSARLGPPWVCDQSTPELRLAWRKVHRTGPPLGLSRDLMIRALATKLQEHRQSGAGRLRQAQCPGIATGRDAALDRGLRAPCGCSVEPARFQWPTDSTHRWMKDGAQVTLHTAAGRSAAPRARAARHPRAHPPDDRRIQFRRPVSAIPGTPGWRVGQRSMVQALQRENQGPDSLERIVQSRDTANKATELSDFSVCTTGGAGTKRLAVILSSALGCSQQQGAVQRIQRRGFRFQAVRRVNSTNISNHASRRS